MPIFTDKYIDVKPKTATVILNWNGKKYLEMFLGTLKSYTDSRISEIIIADNGSTDGSVEWMETMHPEIRVIKLDRNYGFTGGYNRALAQIDAEYFILLNSDVEVTPEWLEHMLDFMESHHECAAVMPKVKSYTDRNRFEYAGACGGFIDILGYPFCRGRILSNIEYDHGQYDNAREVFWASGVCLMIRSELYRSAGGLEESFFAHMEEIDLCWRLRNMGYSICIVPESVIYHVGGGTLPNNSPHKLYLNYRNNLLMMYRNLPAGKKGFIIFIRKCLDGLSALVYLIQGHRDFFDSVIKAHRDYGKMKNSMSILPVHAEKESRHRCMYRGSVVLHFFLKRCRLRFDDIKDLL